LPNICTALTANLPAADDNSLICCTSHDLTDDWSQPVPISLTACSPEPISPLVWVRSFIEPDLFDKNVPFDNTTQIYALEIRVRLKAALF